MDDYEQPNNSDGLFPINAYQIRMLCENPFDGGGGYDVNQVANMTLDQIYFRLCNAEVLKRDLAQTMPTINVDVIATTTPQNDSLNDGLMAGRLVDGTLVRRPMGSKSVARQMIEEAEKKAAQTKQSRRDSRRERKERRRRKKDS